MINQELISDGVESVKCILESNPGHIGGMPELSLPR